MADLSRLYIVNYILYYKAYTQDLPMLKNREILECLCHSLVQTRLLNA